MTVSTVAAKGREQQEQQIARFIKLSVMGSAVVHLAALAFVMPLINLKSDGTEDPIEFIVLEESTATPEELMPEPEVVESATPEPIEELMPEPEVVESATPEPIEELMPEPEVVESATPEPIEEMMSEPVVVESVIPEAMEEMVSEPDGVESAGLELTEEPEPWDAGEEHFGTEVPEAIAPPRSDLRAEALPGVRPPQPIPDPAPMPADEMSPLMNSSPLDPGHSSRIADAQDIQRDSRGTESVTLGRLPDVPEVKRVEPTEGEPLGVEEESPFNPGAIANGESDDPWESNLDRQSEPWNEMEETPEENAGQFPGVEADSTLGETRSLGNESGPSAIACRRCDQPPYPQMALDNGLEGTVILIADIAPDGTVISAAIQRSSSHPILDYAAREQVEQWIFDPSEQGQQGRVIPVTFER